MGFMFGPLLFVMYLVGGENTLSGYVDPEYFWSQQGIEINAESFRAVLQGEEVGPDLEKVGLLIDQLGAEDHAKREEAMEALAGLGGGIRTSLEKALKNPDPEISTRAKKVLENLPELQKEEAGLVRLMAIQGLSDLLDEKSLPLLKKLAEGDSLEAAMAGRAVQTITAKGKDAAQPEARDSVLGRFPEITMAMAQVQVPTEPTVFSKRLKEMPSFEPVYRRLFSAFGEITVHQITGGINRDVLKDDDLLVGMIYVEMEYHSLYFAKWLIEEFDFQAAKKDEIIYLHKRNMVLWPASDQQLVVLLHDGREPGENLIGLLPGFNKPAKEPVLNDGLQTAVKTVPKEATVWVAGFLPEKVDLPLPEAELLKWGSISAQMKKESIGFEAVLTGEGEEAVQVQTKNRLAEKEALLVELGEEFVGPEEHVTALFKLLKGLEVKTEGASVQVKGELPMSFFSGLLSEFERFERRRQMRRQRNF